MLSSLIRGQNRTMILCTRKLHSKTCAISTRRKGRLARLRSSGPVTWPKNYEPSLKWAWIDTCCIDKSSSSELTETINSMFLWYRQAKVCFVYLGDLPQSPTADPEARSSRDHVKDFFPRCRWFTRGWTLQELIAPNEMEFYDLVWMRRGTKSTLKRIISSTTGVDISVLDDSENFSTIPVGRRMSWISKRNTKRVEDIAYCLFGIFDVNMPLIYGEMEKAIVRLQTVIGSTGQRLVAVRVVHRQQQRSTRSKRPNVPWNVFPVTPLFQMLP